VSAARGTRTAIVTGGTRGIGLGIARALARDGWNLMVSGLRPFADVAETVAGLAASGVEVAYCASDIAKADDRRRLVEATLAQFGTPQALVNNAGRAPRTRADLLEASEESFAELISTNLQGPYFLTQAVARLMVDDAVARGAGPGSAAPAAGPDVTPVPGGIVFVTSVSAEMASVNRGEYCVSKAGLAMAARLFATRLAVHRIPVFEVRPGIIATDMTAGVKSAYDQRIADGLVPDRRWGFPEDVGRAVAALLRGDVPYATGTIVHVDGGLALPRL
jgi:NAD(P)-dependent dehydrogenase (short-subunit alcohol dehydrogenase family)